MSYETTAAFAQTWGLVYMLILFLGVIAYAFWPGNKEKFERAARLPLQED